MSKTVEISVLVTCEDEEEFGNTVDNILDLVGTWGGAVSFPDWTTVPDDPTAEDIAQLRQEAAESAGRDRA